MVAWSSRQYGSTMSIVKRGNSKYWYLQFQMNGRTYIRSSRTTNKKIAEQMEIEWKAKLHSHQFLGQKERVTVDLSLEQFCATKVGSPNYSNLLSHVKSIRRLLPVYKPMDELTLHDLERFKRDRLNEGIGGQSLKHSFNLIRGAWKYARKLGYQVSDLDFPQIKVPKYSLRYLNEEEERRLLIELDPKREGKGLKPYAERSDELQRTMQDAYDLVVLLLDTGARYSEIAKIGWSKIDLNQWEIHLWRPKVQNEAVLFMTDRVYDILKRRSETATGDWVFRNKNNGPRGYASVSIRKALRRAGLSDCKIHTLRHTHASRLIQNGMTVYEVREILGHTDIKTTMRYAHLEQRQVTSKARDVINRLNQQSRCSNEANGKTVEAQKS
jgi:integrase